MRASILRQPRLPWPVRLDQRGEIMRLLAGAAQRRVQKAGHRVDVFLMGAVVEDRRTDRRDAVEVWQGDELIFRMEGGISLSEDPNFRFTYAPNGAKTLRVVAHDNTGGSFKAEWPIAEGS